MASTAPADAPLGAALRAAVADPAVVGTDATLARVASAWLRTTYENVYSGRIDDLPLAARVEPFRMPGDDRTIIGPLDRLVDDLAASLDVRCGHVVVGVRPGTARGSTTVGSGWVCDLADGTTVEAAAVVLAVPLGPLQSGQLRVVPLPEAVAHALDHLGMGAVTKVVATFDERFWVPEEAFLLVELELVERELVELEVWVDVTALTGVPALCGFATGDAAVDLETFDEPDLCALVDRLLSRIVATAR